MLRLEQLLLKICVNSGSDIKCWIDVSISKSLETSGVNVNTSGAAGFVNGVLGVDIMAVVDVTQVGITVGIDVSMVVDAKAVDVTGGDVTAGVGVMEGVDVTAGVDIMGGDVTAGIDIMGNVTAEVDVMGDVTGVDVMGDVTTGVDVMGGVDVRLIHVTTGGDVTTLCGDITGLVGGRAAAAPNKGVEVLVSGIIAGVLVCGASSLAKTATTVLLIDSILVFSCNKSDLILVIIKF